MPIALLARMTRVAPALLVLLSLSGLACTSADATATGAAGAESAAPLPAGQESLLGSYEVRLKATPYGDATRTRVDFVNQNGTLGAFLQGRSYAFGFVRLKVESVTDAEVTTSFTMRGQAATFTVRRTLEGKPALGVLTANLGFAEQEGSFGADETAPELVSSEPGLPWEISKVRLSEGLLPGDISINPSGETAFSLVPIANTPWIGAIGVRRPLSSSWDAIDGKLPVVSLAGIGAADPSGNSLKSNRLEVRTLPIGRAVKGYDFSKDAPAYPPLPSRLVGDCDGAEACLRLSQGNKLGLRVAAGNKVLRVRYALRAGTFANTPPSGVVGISAFVAPGDGTEPKVIAAPDVSFSAVSAPTATRAFATPWLDLEIPLPREAAETGITLQFAGEPRDPSAAPPSTDTPNPTVPARHMILLVKSAVAE